ncbi:MAG TPA: D-alanyl-D-alanine carboxypeptidase family protein [Syntrophales bacterium]|nr:D-alanyl-D-alanine carboxypeptidase family protein [Syntrophales bacterium]
MVTSARFCLIGMVILTIFASSASALNKRQVHPGKVQKQPFKTVDTSVISRDPYIGAIVVDAATGQVIFNDNGNAKGYPASVIKLMDLLIILENVKQGTVKLTDRVLVAPEAANVGGSQVYLKKAETFSIDDLLYALMVKSANDAAVALAVHVAGSKEAFIEVMNRKAQELGMASTHFYSVNGLPPQRGQAYDESTPHDLTILARAVLKYPDTLRYTSTKRSTLRNGTFSMGNHNHLLGVVRGCDGLKTGYFFKAGFSIVATAQRNKARIIAIVLGSRSLRTRDFKAKELLEKGFTLLPPQTPDTVHTQTAAITNHITNKPNRRL